VNISSIFGDSFLSYNHIKKKKSIFDNCWKIFTFDLLMHQGYSLRHQKQPPKFEIKALFRQVVLHTHTHTHINEKSIHSTLRSKFKTTSIAL